jgi:hypothetical protein
MPRETDQARLDLLWKLVARRWVIVRDRADRGSDEPNDVGLERLLPARLTRDEKRTRLLHALEGHLRCGRKVSRVDVAGDAVRGDPATFYEFRLELAGRRIYVKTELKNDDPDDPFLEIKSVKLRD